MYISELRKLTLSKIWAKLAEFSNSSARVMQADRTALLGLGMPAKTQDQGKFNFCGDVIDKTKILNKNLYQPKEYYISYSLSSIKVSFKMLSQF